MYCLFTSITYVLFSADYFVPFAQRWSVTGHVYPTRRRRAYDDVGGDGLRLNE